MQLSVADTEPKAARIAASLGLQPKVAVVPVRLITGGVLSILQVRVWVMVVGIPLQSLAVHERVQVLLQSGPLAAPGFGVTVASLQPPLKVGVTKLASIFEGLQPRSRVKLVAAFVTVGAVLSTVQVRVWVIVVFNPLQSVASHERVHDLLQPVPVGAPRVGVTVAWLQPPSKVGATKLASIFDGLHPSGLVKLVAPLFTTGAALSTVQVTVCDTGAAGLPQASLTFQVFF